MDDTPFKAVPAHVKARSTGRWAETICRALGARVAKRWKFVSFRGGNGGEWRGVVDVLAIRKSTAQPTDDALKLGDLFDIILIQVKGGSARGPTASDCARLRKVARQYHARAVAQFQWKKADSSSFFVLGRGTHWEEIEPVELFR
jgi:hypothetical protein